MRIIRGKLILKYYLIRNIYMHNGQVRAYFLTYFTKSFGVMMSVMLAFHSTLKFHLSLIFLQSS